MALHTATKHGHTEIVQALLTANAGVNTPVDSYGRTVLHVAAERGYLKMVKLLLKETSRVNDSVTITVERCCLQR